jgi:hypothetical protein
MGSLKFCVKCGNPVSSQAVSVGKATLVPTKARTRDRRFTKEEHAALRSYGADQRSWAVAGGFVSLLLGGFGLVEPPESFDESGVAFFSVLVLLPSLGAFVFGILSRIRRSLAARAGAQGLVRETSGVVRSSTTKVVEVDLDGDFLQISKTRKAPITGSLSAGQTVSLSFTKPADSGSSKVLLLAVDGSVLARPVGCTFAAGESSYQAGISVRTIKHSLVILFLAFLLLPSFPAVSAAPFCRFSTVGDTSDDFHLFVSPFGLGQAPVRVDYQIDGGEWSTYKRYEDDIPVEGPAIPISPGRHTIAIRCVGRSGTATAPPQEVDIQGGVVVPTGPGPASGIGILLALLGMILALAGPSVKPISEPWVLEQDRTADVEVDLDKKIRPLKTDQEVADQEKFFQGQQRWGELKAGSRVYLNSFHEIPHRIMDDPLTKYTAGPFVKMMDSGLDLVKSAVIMTTDGLKGVLISPDVNSGEMRPKVKYDPEVDKYYYDFHDRVTGKEALTDFTKSSLEVALHKAPDHVFKAARSLHLESIGAPAAPYQALPADFNIFRYYDTAPVKMPNIFGGWIQGPKGLEWLQSSRIWIP